MHPSPGNGILWCPVWTPPLLALWRELGALQGWGLPCSWWRMQTWMPCPAVCPTSVPSSVASPGPLPSVLPENSPLTRPRAAAPLSFTYQLSVCLCVTYKLQCISWPTSSCPTLTTVHHFLTLFEYSHYFDQTGFLLPLAELRCFFSVFKSLSLGSLPHIWIVDSFLQPGHLSLLIYEPNLLTN